jgi:hypothetical protein
MKFNLRAEMSEFLPSTAWLVMGRKKSKPISTRDIEVRVNNPFHTGTHHASSPNRFLPKLPPFVAQACRRLRDVRP